MQDLEDIRNGIQIIHASDAEKRNKENKKERRQKLRESAIRRLEKKLLENGYESLEKFRQTGAMQINGWERNGLRKWNRCAWKKREKNSQYN